MQKKEEEKGEVISIRTRLIVHVFFEVVLVIMMIIMLVAIRGNIDK